MQVVNFKCNFNQVFVGVDVHIAYRSHHKGNDTGLKYEFHLWRKSSLIGAAQS